MCVCAEERAETGAILVPVRVPGELVAGGGDWGESARRAHLWPCPLPHRPARGAVPIGSRRVVARVVGGTIIYLLYLTLSSPLLYPYNSADRDRPSATSIKPTTAFRAAIGTAPLAYIMRVTSELLVVARAACGLCLKDTCMDERDDCERVGADLQ